MAQKNFTCGDKPLLTIRAEENLSIRGGAVTEVQATIEELDDLMVTEIKNGLIIVCSDDCVLMVPENAQVAIDAVGGNVSVSELKGNLYLSEIGGNVTLTNIGDTAIKKVDGNCHLDGAGNVSIEDLDGNLKGSNVTGPLNAIRVDGNIKIRSIGVAGKLEADGNIEAGIQNIANDVEITADGNIYLELPDNPNFILEASVGGKITSILGAEMRNFTGAAHGVQFGEGGPTLKMTAGGNITFSTMGSKATGQTFSQDEYVYAGVKWQKMNERIQKRIDERIRKAERKAEAVQRKAERRVHEAMKSVGGIDIEGIISKSLHSAGWPFSTDETANTSHPEGSDAEQVEEREKVTDAERMLVLNMLHEKKITAEEAERLLDALEGKFQTE